MRRTPASLRFLASCAVLAALVIAAGCAGSDSYEPRESDPQTATRAPAPSLAATDLRLPEPRPAQPSGSDLARGAKKSFWGVFDAGQYQALPGVIRLLTAAYLENPRDAEVTLLLAHAHLWKLAERRRLDERDPTITDHMVLAEQYFEEAYRLNPADHRIIGWLGSVRMPLGGLRQDSALAREGYLLLEEAARRYPEFNHFTAGFAMSGLPATDERYQRALEHVWQNVEQCGGTRGNEALPGRSAYELAQEADPSCANTRKAPHNYEGFMLNLGDMLVKAGESEQARSVYARARLSPVYEEWPYREKVEQRILNAEEAAALFARTRSPEADPEIMFGSAYSCAACHQRQ